jgi:hypothetical protein
MINLIKKEKFYFFETASFCMRQHGTAEWSPLVKKRRFKYFGV